MIDSIRQRKFCERYDGDEDQKQNIHPSRIPVAEKDIGCDFVFCCVTEHEPAHGGHACVG